jgi:hypothetical protein
MGVAPGLLFVVSLARAQASGPATSDSLSTARAHFAEALQDEEAARFAIALQKFERVREVRDTPSIEFRIGTCYEGLERPAPAFRAYRAATILAGPGNPDPQSADVARAASERLEALGKHLAQLTLAMPNPPPAGVEVRVDDDVVASAGVDPIPLGAGPHVVSASAPGAAPFRAEIALAEGAQVSLTVTLEPAAMSPPAPPQRRTPSVAAGAWLAIGTSAALLTASAILLVVRHDDIATLNRSCPGGTCPPGADADDLESTRSRALVEGPVALACGVAGVAAAGVGLYWIARGRRSIAGRPTLPIVPIAARGGGGLAFTGAFR